MRSSILTAPLSTALAAILFALSLSAAPPAASTHKPVPLWPNGAPNDKGTPDPEKDMTTAKDNLIAGRPLIRLGNVSQPTLTVYPAPRANNTGAAVVVFPGGGYRILALDLEGTEVCEWLNRIGVTGVLVKYRVPAREGGPRYAAPLQDAQRAMGWVRTHAAEYGINPTKIGVLGFSAGGHLSAAISNIYEARTYDSVDAADATSCRPDFAVLVYPAYLAVKEEQDRIPDELKITAKTPPSFIVQTEDDPVRVENSVSYYLGLKKAGVPVEMHLYAKGGHGYGLRKSELPVTGWPNLVEQWLRSENIISTPATAAKKAH